MRIMCSVHFAGCPINQLGDVSDSTARSLAGNGWPASVVVAILIGFLANAPKFIGDAVVKDIDETALLEEFNDLDL